MPQEYGPYLASGANPGLQELDPNYIIEVAIHFQSWSFDDDIT